MNTLSQLIGNTPLIKLSSYSTPDTNIYAKLEGQNIGGSIKDRVALAMIEDLEQRGILTRDKTIIEPSSGNTGIGLAMLGTAKGYKVKIVMPETATPERIKILKKYGAEVELCKKEDWKGDTAIQAIKRLAADDPNYVMPNQYENPACVDIHYRTTAEEIIRQCPDITHLVATIGTGGTITGIGKRLKEYNPNIRMIGVEIRSDSRIPGPRNIDTYVPPIIDFQYIDDRIKIEDEDAVFKLAETLCKEEGLFCGISSAAALSVAVTTGVDSNHPKNIVVIFPDKGEKYLSM